MRSSEHTTRWFPVALFVLMAGGGLALLYGGGVSLDERQWRFFLPWHLLASAFDALSAACGVGLLVRDLHRDYTPAGRWMLVAIGLAGTAAYLLAAARAAARLRGPHAGGRWPSGRSVVVGLFVVTGLATAVYTLAMRVAGHAVDHTTAWEALSAAASLGWNPGGGSLAHWSLALVAWCGAVGWPVWLLALPVLRKRYVHARTVLLALAGYLAVLAGAALLIWGLETPRAVPTRMESESPVLTRSPAGARFGRSLAQVVSASGAGLATEDLSGRQASPGTKFTLGTLVLIGGLGGSATGGIKWPILCWTLAAAGVAFGPRRARTTNLATTRYVQAAVSVAVVIGLLVVLVALGLLLIDTLTADPYDTRSTFADAFLDASSAVGGGGLSSGLTQAVTSQNRSSGIRQSVDQYQYGMVWLMLAMLAGRVLPVYILWRVASLHYDDAPRGAPPLL